MAGNSIGKIFKLTTFGESHSDFTGGVIDGCPSGLKIDIDFIELEIQILQFGRIVPTIRHTKIF